MSSEIILQPDGPASSPTESKHLPQRKVVKQHTECAAAASVLELTLSSDLNLLIDRVARYDVGHTSPEHPFFPYYYYYYFLYLFLPSGISLHIIISSVYFAFLVCVLKFLLVMAVHSEASRGLCRALPPHRSTLG